jgi:protein transport protein SEC23
VNVLFACPDASALSEIQKPVFATGGWIVSGDSWREEHLAKTVVKYFETVVHESGVNVTLSVNCSKTMRIPGTDEQRLSGMLSSTTLSCIVEINDTEAIEPGSQAVFQFVTKYRQMHSGLWKLRVTTHAVPFADMAAGTHFIARSFDQEAGVVLMARQAICKLAEETAADVIHHLDRVLITFCRKFGGYTAGDANSFVLAAPFIRFPQCLYHFRRSPFVLARGPAGERLSTIRRALMQADVNSSLLMIQPSLMRYSAGRAPRQVLLDESSLDASCVLLLDSFFGLLVWHGAEVVGWRTSGSHLQPDGKKIRELLKFPLGEAKALLDERFPVPHLFVCDQDSPQAQYLRVRCIPSGEEIEGLGGRREANLGNDEPSFPRFFAKLKVIAVSS